MKTSLREVRKTLGAEVRQLWLHQRGHAAPPEIVRKTTMVESSGTLGGYTVPTELLLGLDAHLQEECLFHRLGMVFPMHTNTCLIPSFDLTASHATGASPMFGGMVMTPVVEAGTISQTNPSFAQGQLIARNIYGLIAITNQLLTDGGEQLGVYLEAMFYKLVEWTTEYYCCNGNGTNQPLGIASALNPAAKVVTRAGGGTISDTDVSKMVGALFPACAKRAVWMASPSAVEKVVDLAQYQFSEPAPMLAGYLVGKPLYVTEKLPAVGTRGDIMLFDPSMYALGQRELLIELDSQSESMFNANQSQFRVTWRGDGQPLPRGTFTLADGSTSSGCFVCLS